MATSEIKKREIISFASNIKKLGKLETNTNCVVNVRDVSERKKEQKSRNNNKGESLCEDRNVRDNPGRFWGQV